MKKMLFLCLFILGSFSLIYSDTIHNTNITSDETWYPAGNPHIITTNITVSTGVTLTISAGCDVKLDYNKILYVSGTFNATGTSGNRIIFDYNGEGSTWYAIQIQGAASSANFSYCTIQNSTYGMTGTTNVPMITVDHCNFYNNTYGASLYISGSVFTDCIFQDNTTGIQYNDCDDLDLGVNNEFSNNTTAVKCINSNNPAIDLQQPVANNDNGFWFENCGDPVIATGNSFTDNTNYGIRFKDCTGLGTLDNLTLTGNEGYGGLWIQSSGDFLLGSSITNTGNNWPLSIDVGSYPDPSSQIPTTGNTNNDIRVTAGNSYTTGTWPYFPDLGYIFTTNSTIQNVGSLTIADGNTIKFDYNKILYVSGTLNAIGTSRSGINFDYNGEGSTWYAIQIQNASSSANFRLCFY